MSTPNAGYIILVLIFPPFSKTGVAITSYQGPTWGQIVLLALLERFWKLLNEISNPYIYIYTDPLIIIITTENYILYHLQACAVGPGTSQGRLQDLYTT